MVGCRRRVEGIIQQLVRTTVYSAEHCRELYIVKTCHRYLRKIHAHKVSTNLAPEKDHIVDNN